jgi:hypothetical protein
MNDLIYLTNMMKNLTATDAKRFGREKEGLSYCAAIEEIKSD